MSVPTCSGPNPAAAAAPAPPLEPPVVHAGFQGLRVMPCRLETPEDNIPQSDMVVDPSTTAPDSWTRAVMGASAVAQDTEPKTAYFGTPARPAKEMHRINTALGKLPELLTRVRELEAKLLEKTS